MATHDTAGVKAILFDIDGTLIVSGGAGTKAWKLAFDELYGIPADIGQFADAGMTDPEVGRRTFEAVLHRKPERREFTRLLEPVLILVMGLGVGAIVVSMLSAIFSVNDLPM